MKSKILKIFALTGIVALFVASTAINSGAAKLSEYNNQYKGNYYKIQPQSGINEDNYYNPYNNSNMPTKARIDQYNKQKGQLCREGEYQQYNIIVCGNEKDQVISYKEFNKDGSIHYTEDYTWHENGHLSITHTRDYGSGEGGDDFRTYNGNQCRETYNQISLSDGHRLWGWEHDYCHDNEPHYSTYRL